MNNTHNTPNGNSSSKGRVAADLLMFIVVCLVYIDNWNCNASNYTMALFSFTATYDALYHLDEFREDEADWRFIVLLIAVNAIITIIGFAKKFLPVPCVLVRVFSIVTPIYYVLQLGRHTQHYLDDSKKH